MKEACVLCGHLTFRTWCIVEGTSIVSCQACRLFFVHPQPTHSERESQYSQNKSSPADYYTQTMTADRETFQQRLALIERHRSPGRLLDVGCTIGTFMQESIKRGWNAVGLEPNPAACRYAREAGLSVVEGFLSKESWDQLGRDFDVVHMGDVLEHVANPQEAVRVAASGLKRGGLLSITTPDFESFVARKFQVKPFEHLFYFTEKTLSNLLTRCGLHIEVLIHTTRRRDLKSVSLGTTRVGPGLQFLINGAQALGLVNALSWICAWLIRDELFVLARRPEGSAQ